MSSTARSTPGSARSAVAVLRPPLRRGRIPGRRLPDGPRVDAQVSGYIADPRVRGVTLTGSDRAGSAVGEQAGRNIKPVVLELGGSDAFIVLDSADVARAAGTAAACRLRIGGQVCISPKRIIVTEAVADEFIGQFSATFASYKLG